MIKLSDEHFQAIRVHAESAYPKECCGLLLGKLQQESKTIVEVMATANVWNAETSEPFSGIDAQLIGNGDQHTHYTIAPETMLQAQRAARDRQLHIIGIYHSHPDYTAVPSEFDRVYAWQQYSYIIVSVHQGKACDFNSWILDDHHQFQTEEITVI